MENLKKIVDELYKIFYGLLIGWLVNFIKLLKEFCRIKKHKDKLREDRHIYTRCQVIPSKYYKRPDPMIYSQEYLMKQGKAVTWDNPDIQLYTINPVTKGKLAAISSNELAEDTDYIVEATIYNGSTEAPAINMGVDFSFLTFGIGTTSTSIGSTTADLPVKGAPNHPTHADVIWRTPKTAGHYCLQVRLNWKDDANPNNNMGQENTNVGMFHSPATFEFPVKNSTTVEEFMRLEVDTYTLGEPIDCNEVTNGRYVLSDRVTHKPIEGKELCKLLASRHNAGNFPVPVGWSVDISPNNFVLGPGQEQLVKVTIACPDTFTGTQAFNVNAYDKKNQLVGGVTLYTKR